MPNNGPSGADELYDVVDEQGRVVGRATRAQVHADPNLIHRAVHVLVFRSSGEVLLQKRVLGKDIEPGKWDTSVGGHVDAGEDFLTAALREMKEELGIEGLELEFMYDLKYRSVRESEDIKSYRIIYDGSVSPHWFEIAEVRDWRPEEVDEAVGKGIFTPNFEEEWKTFRSFDRGRADETGRDREVSP